MNTSQSGNILFRVENVLTTLWVGGMWVIGYVVAPILFVSLDPDRQLAGALAGHMFTAINYIGLGCGGLLLIFALQRAGRGWPKDLRVIALLVMLALILMAMLVLQPMMEELKQIGLVEGGETMARFGRLHGVSAVLYLVASLLGLFLVASRRN